MAGKIYTAFQEMSKVFDGGWNVSNGIANTQPLQNPNDVIYKTEDPQQYQQKKLELQQNKYLANRWKRVNQNLSMSAFAGLSNVQLMYRDADLMDAYPEIGAALDEISEEATLPSSDAHGMIVKVSSKSDRIKSILEDLFVNRLNLQVTAQMVVRAMCKYGNQFMLLDIDKNLGVKGWRQLPVAEVERVENGIVNPYGGGGSNVGMDGTNGDMSTKFIWTNELGGNLVPFKNWQVAHFRLLHNSMYLPYGVSALLSARRHFRMLALMEDSMLIYRLERSMERRVYKIYVGALDDDDIQPYVEQVADQFKRTPIVDPLTGQLDLRKNILPVWRKTPIPLLDGRTITIEELAKEYEEGKVNHVYSVQDNTHQIVPGKVVWCGKNYCADKLYKITLDDDTYMVMAGEHEIIMRDGSKKRADEVKSGESVMPLYRRDGNVSYSKKSYYEETYNPHSGQFEFTHRLIGECVEKSKSTDTTIHHKDFNKFNNSPENLQWMEWLEHRRYHISLNSDPRIRQLRGMQSRTRWQEEAYREKASRNMTTFFDDYVWGEIDKKIIDGTIYTQKKAIDFVNNNLIGYLIETNSSKKLKHYRKVSKPMFKARVQNRGYKDFDSYLSMMQEKYNLVPMEERLRKQRSESAKKYDVRRNFGPVWTKTDKKDYIISRIIESNKHRDYTPVGEKNRINFTDNIWESLRENIVKRNLNNKKDIINFLNENFIDEINENSYHEIKKVGGGVVRERLKEKGFESTKNYIDSIRKNHKIKKVEIVEGDDVYCMTVVGDNGEEDRHNFGLQTLTADGEVCRNGCFVSNCASDDIFVPTRTENSNSPIETLSGAKNLDAIDDIKYIQKKVCAALRIPQSFLNFEESQGDGKNLALMDVRFARTINKYQQAFLMELTKIATIHLYLLGFEDDLTNFNLTMNNPSTQSEQLEIENLQKKISVVRDAVSDPGNGMPVISLQRALKEILKWSDKEIKDNFEEIRLERALSAELEKTEQIIKRTGVFDTVDRIYGEPGAEYQEEQGGPGPQGGGPGGDAGGGGFGGGLDMMGAPGGDEGMEEVGQEGEEPTAEMGAEPPAEGPEPAQPMESVQKKKPLLTEEKVLKQHNKNADKVFDKIVEGMIRKSHEGEVKSRVDVFDKTLRINEEFEKMFGVLDDFKNATTD